MTRTTFIQLAASAAILSVGLSGCSTGMSGDTRSASAAHDRHAASAEKALQRGDALGAIAAAEEAVARNPGDPGNRALLGQAYLAAGRFASAERSFADVIELDGADARSVIGLALARTALGKPDMARETLNAHRAILPAADYGLAIALAGDSATGVDVLTQAIRQSDDSPRTRQNLALAYALGGQWKDAQLMAARDAAPDQVLASLADWARIARPGAYQARVASLLKVTPDLADPGQPVRLALRPAEPAMMPVETAEAAPAVPAYNAALPATGPAVAVDDGAPLAPVAEADTRIVPVALPASMPSTPAQPVAESAVRLAALAGPAPLLSRQPTRPVRQPAVAAKPKAAATKSVAKFAAGTSAVQLGAFESEAVARAAWQRLSKKFGALSGLKSSTAKAVVNGKTFYRLAAVNLARADATRLCGALKTSGRDCFVRPMADTRMAAAPAVRKAPVATVPKKLASR